MKTHRGLPNRLNAKTALLLAIATSAAASLIGCESPLNSDYAQRDRDNYTESLIAHAVLQGNAGPILSSTTFNGGVQELPRVDQVGPNIITPPSTTRPSYATVSTIGVAAAALHMYEPVVGLSLQEVIARAAKHSQAIKVEGYNPAINESKIIEAEASFDPTVFGVSQWNDTHEPAISQPNFSNGQSWENQIGVRKLLPTGATVSASTSITYHAIDLNGTTPSGGTSSSSASFNGIKNGYSANFNFSITQPLLRGFGTDVNEANIYLAQRDFRISLSDFKKQAMSTIADVENAYFNLVLARTNVDIAERLVIETEDTYNLVKARQYLDATKASIGQTLNSLEIRRALLVQAQTAYRHASDDLKNLMNDPEFDIHDNTLINPTDSPMIEPVYYDIAQCIETALRQRPELQSQRLKIEEADIQVAVAKNGLLPKLNLVAGLQTNGLDSSFDDAFSATVRPSNGINGFTGGVDFNAGVTLEFPIGNRFAEATLKQHQNERRQAVDSLVQAALQIVDDVRHQMREVFSNFDQIQRLNQARLAAAEYVQGILEIENIRPKTPEFLLTKLDSQAALATAEQSLTTAIVNYNIAIMKLEQAKGTLLEYDRISLDRPPAPSPADDRTKLRFIGHSYDLSK